MMIINRKSENFQKVYEIFEKELQKEGENVTRIQLENGRIFVEYPSFFDMHDENTIMQFVPKKIIDGVPCTGCNCQECSGKVEEKIEHILFDFFEEPEVFIGQEFLQEHPDFFE